MDNWEEVKTAYTVGVLGTVTAASEALAPDPAGSNSAPPAAPVRPRESGVLRRTAPIEWRRLWPIRTFPLVRSTMQQLFAAQSHPRRSVGPPVARDAPIDRSAGF